MTCVRQPYTKVKSGYGGMEVPEGARLKTPEDENANMKQPLADTVLNNIALKYLLEKLTVRDSSKRQQSFLGN